MMVKILWTYEIVSIGVICNEYTNAGHVHFYLYLLKQSVTQLYQQQFHNI